MEIDRKKISSYFMFLTIVAVVIYFNVSYFSNRISVNDTSITGYMLSDDDINPIRETAVAGLFYPASSYQLDKDIDGYIEHASSGLSNRPHILIVPHAGYRYSAQVAAHAYKRLLPFKKQIKRVFLLGPSHKVAINGVALPAAKKFKTPLGLVAVDEEIISELKQNKLFKVSAIAHKNEHSLEVQLPFLQKTLRDFKIIPLLYGDVSAYQLAEILMPWLKDNDTLLVVSADLSHYLDYETAQKVDEQTGLQIKNLSEINYHQSCGATGINTAMVLARKMGLVPQLLDMVNSGDAGDDKSKVVGYGAWSYEEPEVETEREGLDLEEYHLQNFARHWGTVLYDIAVKNLKAAVEGKEAYYPKRSFDNNVLFNRGAAFVTLRTKNGDLRGCIGSILPVKAIAVDVADNVRKAALSDLRFNPVTVAELEDLDLSIALLTNFEEINFNSYADLLSKIKEGVDGVLIRDGQREGVFLPAMWQEFSDKHEFMTQLKIKAGLSPTYWTNRIKAYRFKTVEIKNDQN